MPSETVEALSAPVPVPPARQYSFTGWQVSNPTTPPPGDRLDAEYDRLRAAILRVIDWVEASLARSVSRDSVGDANAASDAEGAAALAYRYAILAQAWAEYMPGTIPPNILAVMDITGDHWSSRWWAHQAAIGGDPSPPVESTPPQTLGRNLLHNALFNVAQRGAGVFSAVVSTWTYAMDRWRIIIGSATGETLHLQQVAPTASDVAEIGDEAAAHLAAANFVGSSAAAACCIMSQPIEDVRRLAGKTVTVSFWAVAGGGPLRLGVSLDQYYGGGSGSSGLVVGTGQSVIVWNTAWIRYSLTFSLPSSAGKTLGDLGDNNTTVLFWLSSGANNQARSGNVGLQQGTIELWGVQLEIGSAATPVEKPDPQYDLSNCQRFYQTGVLQLYGYQTAGNGIALSNMLAVPMRNLPVVVPAITLSVNVSSPVIGALSSIAVNISGTATASGPYELQGSYTATADL
jgi:hypothetical protein